MMPGRLPFTRGEWVQIMALSELERKSYNKCPDCHERDRHAVKTCFYCGKEYSEAQERQSRRGQAHHEHAEAHGDGGLLSAAVNRHLQGGAAPSTAGQLARERASGEKTKEEQRAVALAALAKTLGRQLEE